MQLFVNDPRATPGGLRTETAKGGAGATVTIDYNTNNSNGGVGQFVLGTFTADATSQTIGFIGAATSGNPSAQVNGLQLRVVPEPGSALLLGLGGLALTLRRRRR